MKRLLTVMLAVFIAAGLSLWIALPVVAQDEAADEEKPSDEFTLEEVTVTAEKSEQDLQKISRSMAVLSAEDLKLNSSNDFMEALGNVGGVTFMGMWNHIYVRGIGHSTAEEGSEPGVQFNVDGAPALLIERGTVSPMYQASNDVERIEVIRGPSGSVNGRSAAAGTVNVITKSPDFERLDGNVGITIGNYDTVRLNSAFNLPLKLTGLNLPSFLENLSLRVAAAENRHSGYVHNGDGEEVGGSQNNMSVRTKLKWQPIEPLTLEATLNYMRDASNMGMSVPPIESGDRAHPDDPWLNESGGAMSEPGVSRQYSTAYEATYETGIGTIYGRYTYSWVPVNCRADDQNCYEGKRGQKDYEIRLNSPEDSRIKWYVGGYFFNKKTYTGPDSQIGDFSSNFESNFYNYYGQQRLFESDYATFDPRYDPPGGTAGWDINDDQDTQPWSAITGVPVLANGEIYYFAHTEATRPINSYSGFANATIPLFEDRHRLVIGIRKNFERKERAYSLGVYGPAESEAEVAAINEQRLADLEEGEEFIEAFYNDGYPHFYFDENIGPDGLPAGDGTWKCDNCLLRAQDGPNELKTDDDPFSFTLGWEWDFRQDVMFYVQVSNGYKPGGISPNAVPNVFYEPETVINYAVGSKSRWFDQRLQLNGEIFYMDYENYQQNIANDNMLLVADFEGDHYEAIGFQSVTVNFPKTKIYGFDLDYEWLITPLDRFSGNLEYKHAYYPDFVYYLGPSADPWKPLYADYSGRQMMFAPEWSFNGNYSHMFNFGNFQATPRVSAKYSTEYLLFNEYWMENINPEMYQDPYWKFDAYLNMGPQDGTWNVSLYWKNLTEEPVRLMALFTNVNVDEPMTYGATFNMRF